MQFFYCCKNPKLSPFQKLIYVSYYYLPLIYTQFYHHYIIAIDFTDRVNGKRYCILHTYIYFEFVWSVLPVKFLLSNRRNAEVRASESINAVKKIIYALIGQRFIAVVVLLWFPSHGNLQIHLEKLIHGLSKKMN